MKKLSKLYIILSICLLALCGCKDSTNIDNTTNQSYNSNRLSVSTKDPKKEVKVSEFSTNILDRTPNRVDNISLTCSKINGIIVHSGETFSFCDAVGEVSSRTGYKEADILDNAGKVFKGYGGGNCQVSTTLYNAVYEISDIEIVEKHEHSKQVYYVEKSKDAAVNSNSKLDFKFKNNTNYDIKIYASNTNEEVAIEIMKLE